MDLYDLKVALNDLRFNYRMWKRKERGFISDKCLELDFKTINEVYEKNKIAFSKVESIVVTEKVNDRFEAKMVDASDDNYASLYDLQCRRFEKYLEICKMIRDYVKDYDRYDDEVERLMGEVHANVEASYEKEREADNLVESLLKKSEEFDDKFQIKDEQFDASSSDSHALARVTDEVDYYFDKVKKIKEYDSSELYEEDSDYIYDDVELDAEILEAVLEEIKNNYKEKKAISFMVSGENKSVNPEDPEYENLYNFICSHLEVEIQKCRLLKEEDTSEVTLIEPVRDYGQEMIFDETVEYIKDLNKMLKSEFDIDIPLALTWTESSIKILNDLKVRLEDDYNNGNKIKVARLENDRYVVTEEENNLENYQTQLEFLNTSIEEIAHLNQRLNDMKDNDYSKDTVKADLRQDIESKYVVIERGDKVIVVGTGISEEDLDKMDSELLRKAISNGMPVIVQNLGAGLRNIEGILTEVKDDGTIVLGSDVQKVEFHNQDEMIKTYDNLEKDVVKELIQLKNDGNIAEIENRFKDNPSAIWTKFAQAISSGKISALAVKDFVEYMLDNHSDETLLNDELTDNVGYQTLLKMLKMNKKLPYDLEKTQVLKPIDRAMKVKSREKKQNLIDKFKGLKKWQKVAIVAGLTIAGVAVVGAGVYHLVPEVKPMIDEFIKNLNVPNFGMEIPNSIPQVNPVEHTQVVSSSIPNVSSVDYSSFGEGHRVFADSYSAVSGVNPMRAVAEFNGNPLDVFNTNTNQFMHLTSEQLHNPEFLQSLANDPNNTMLFGSDMAHADGFVPISDVISEVVKGGKVL